MGEAKRKSARDATAAEIFPGGHGPVHPNAEALMRELLIRLRGLWPNYNITVFVAEKDVTDGTDRLPRFNYGSTAHRADMIAVMKAFIAKNDEMEAVDRAMNVAPTGRA